MPVWERGNPHADVYLTDRFFLAVFPRAKLAWRFDVTVPIAGQKLKISDAHGDKFIVIDVASCRNDNPLRQVVLFIKVDQALPAYLLKSPVRRYRNLSFLYKIFSEK